MGVWGWIVLYVLLFSVVQLIVYHYLRRDEDAPLFNSTPATRDPGGVEEIRNVEDRVQNDDRVQTDDRARNDDVDVDDSSVVVCPRCGAENETGYTYCRSCVSPMAVR